MLGDILRARVRSRLDDLGINPFEAERRANLKRGYLNDLLIGKKDMLREKALPALAEALECDYEFLIGTQDAPVGAPSGLKISGIAEAGAWRAPGAAGLPTAPLPIPLDPRFDADRLQAYLVRGDHAGGLGILDGSIITILTGEQAQPRDGDVVLAKQVEANGSEEISIKVVSGKSLASRPLKGDPISVPIDDCEIIGRVISTFRVFGSSN